jgi:PPM family protein phosphatase
MKTKAQVIFKTATGIDKAHNEDWFQQFELNNPLGKVLLLADGLNGGVEQIPYAKILGELLAADLQELVKGIGHPHEAAANMCGHVSRLNTQFQQALKVYEFAQSGGSTLVLATIFQNLLTFAWVGDSRLYLYRNQNLKQLTKDHSVVQHYIDEGLIPAEAATSHPQRNLITQCMGSETQKLTPEAGQIQLDSGDLLILCSDGLHGVLSNQQLEHILSREQLNLKTLETLTTEARTAGSLDDITIAFVEI